MAPRVTNLLLCKQLTLWLVIIMCIHITNKQVLLGLADFVFTAH